ncbi:unnamed protein product, partial [Symbiodinium sp. KB8]
MSTSFFDATEGGVPLGHTAFSWTSPACASPALVQLAQAGHPGAAASVAAVTGAPPPGHTAFSWTLGAEGPPADAELVARVEALEARASCVPHNVGDAKSPNHARVEASVLACGVKGAAMFQVPDAYYDWPLEARAQHLCAPKPCLCKTVLLENTAATAPGVTASPFTSRYVAVILQYVSRLDLPRLAKQLRGMADMAAEGQRAPRCLTVPSVVAASITPVAQQGAATGSGGGGGATVSQRDLARAKFNFAVAPADASDRLSGFLHNAVTPFGM